MFSSEKKAAAKIAPAMTLTRSFSAPCLLTRGLQELLHLRQGCQGRHLGGELVHRRDPCVAFPVPCAHCVVEGLSTAEPLVDCLATPFGVVEGVGDALCGDRVLVVAGVADQRVAVTRRACGTSRVRRLPAAGPPAVLPPSGRGRNLFERLVEVAGDIGFERPGLGVRPAHDNHRQLIVGGLSWLQAHARSSRHRLASNGSCIVAVGEEQRGSWPDRVIIGQIVEEPCCFVVPALPHARSASRASAPAFNVRRPSTHSRIASVRVASASGQRPAAGGRSGCDSRRSRPAAAAARRPVHRPGCTAPRGVRRRRARGPRPERVPAAQRSAGLGDQLSCHTPTTPPPSAGGSTVHHSRDNLPTATGSTPAPVTCRLQRERRPVPSY